VSDEGGNGLFVHIVNERAVALDASLHVTLYHAGDVIVGAASRTLRIRERTTVELSAAEMFDDFRDLSYAYRFGAPAQDLVVASLRTGDGSLLSQAFHFVLGLSPARERTSGSPRWPVRAPIPTST